MCAGRRGGKGSCGQYVKINEKCYINKNPPKSKNTEGVNGIVKW